MYRDYQINFAKQHFSEIKGTIRKFNSTTLTMNTKWSSENINYNIKYNFVAITLFYSYVHVVFAREFSRVMYIMCKLVNSHGTRYLPCA